MPTYVAMLRGINVGPHKRMKMEKLRALFEALGFEQVSTYIQSGNVVFNAGKLAANVLSKRIESRIQDDFGFSAAVIARSADEMSATVAGNPFLRQPGIDPEKLHVMFLAETPSSVAVKKLAELARAPEQLRSLGKEIYLYLPDGVANSFWMKNPVDRILGVATTTRNWKTVNQLAKMCEECG